jgi:hypothetical protein
VAARTKLRAREAQLAFEALSIEGGLLSPEWLSKVAQLVAGTQSESDYRIPKGLNLRDEIGRYWRIGQAHWSEFVAGRHANSDDKGLAERFVTGLLRDSFGFTSLAPVTSMIVAERSYPIGHAALSGQVPLVIANAGSGLDSLTPMFGDSGRRRSAFGLAQEYLNAQESAMWGLASDGLTLRALRDNASLTRPAWVEVDLARIFTEERYADFAALWLLLHETRFGREGQPVGECALEVWRTAGREEGTRAREHLRRGVEEALLALGHGFLAHRDNQALRAALQSGALSTKSYFNQLLRLVYRLIFLLTVEERGLLHPEGTSDSAKALYAQGYGLRRLRERAVKRSAHDRFSDLWEAMKIVFQGLTNGEPRLGLPALAGIFAASQCAALDVTKLENRAILLAVFKLAWLREDGSLVRVNWRDMGPEELGSVYESLLELVPQITADGRQFAFATGGETKGNARKTTGSYYTPDSLVQVLLNSALEPVIAETIAKNPQTPIDALLGLSIVDPACGSGHFLLAAARRLASHVARLQANGTPSAAEYRHALRQVVSRCIYGVDLNPMAVELCKVSLWMEAVEPGLPLTFLNSHIQHGNALLGTTPELLAKGIPDSAWQPIEGDDKKVASALKKRNKKGGEGQRSFDTLWSMPSDAGARVVARAIADLESASDTSPEALSKKESQWDDILTSAEYRQQKFVADAWCAAFVWPKQPGEVGEAALTNDLWRQVRDGQGQPPTLTSKTVYDLSDEYRFFHWHLQFPQVFSKGGFDAVVGNPPWEHIELKEEEWFAERRPDIADAPNASTRKRRIERLAQEDPALFLAYQSALRRFDGEAHLIRESGRFPLCARGRINTYAIFAEHNRSSLGPRGYAGFIVPTGIATDDTTKEFFAALVAERHLASLFDFQSGPGLFGEIGHARFKFCLLTLGREVDKVDLLFFARSVPELSESQRHFTLSPSDFAALNPNTKTCPTFRSRRDADINLALYRRTGILWREGDNGRGNPWGIRFIQGIFNMASDSGLFKTRSELEPHREYLPLIEAKMVHHFDHRYGDYSDRPADSENTSLPDVPLDRSQNPSYSPMPRYWLEAEEVTRRLTGALNRDWLLGWRDICRSFDERTVIVSLIPRVAVGHTTPLVFSNAEAGLVAALFANLCSFPLDYAARQKVGGTHLTFSYLKQLPVLPPNTYEAVTAWAIGTKLRDWLLKRVLELSYTAWDLEPFARDVGYDAPPFRWDPARRFLLRCELDAAFFHLYGLSRDETDYVMDTFPIVRKNDEKAHREYRTKRVILEIYDAIAVSVRTGKTYETRLNPAPADQRVAHPARIAKVIPFRPAARSQPEIRRVATIPDLAAVGADDWARPHTHEGGEIQTAVIAVLKAYGAPTDRPQARLAALLCLEPHLLVSHLDGAERENWMRVVGGDARNSASASVDGTTNAWGAALSGLRARGRLTEDPQKNTWEVGADTDVIDTRGWPEGRAEFVVNVLRRMHESQSVDAIIIKLPVRVRQWFEHAA